MLFVTSIVFIAARSFLSIAADNPSGGFASYSYSVNNIGTFIVNAQVFVAYVGLISLLRT